MKSHYVVGIIIALVIFMAYLSSHAEQYEYKGGLTVEAPSYKLAAKLCFKKLNPYYTSEEVGLIAIDICANPAKGEVK